VSGFALIHSTPEPDPTLPVAVVTGGGRNIGRAIAARLREDGYQVLITVFDGRATQDAAGAPASVSTAEAAEIGERLGVDVVACDLADGNACRELVRLVADRYERLDCLINNAATWTYGPALGVSDDVWRYVLEVNVIAILRLIREAHPLLRAAPAPRVVNMSSIGAEWSGNGVGPYNVSKAAVSSLTRALAIELADDGIVINAIAPGFIVTSSNAHELDDPGVLGRRLALIPGGQPGQPDDVAHLVSFLASPRLEFVTGAVVRIDGGQLAGAATGLIE
jgi:3-oxoacyl-[acyl-carrier protein] reductase